MIISHQNKFIFIRIPKTASTSVEVAFSAICGPKDIISGVSFHNDRENAIEGYEGEKNLANLRIHPLTHLVRKLTGQPEIDYKHASAKIIKDSLPSTQWNSYFKFCFVRNPFDRAVSLYYWRMKNWEKKHDQERPSVSDYILSLAPEKLSTWQRYTINGKVAVDHVARFENLQGEIDAICQRLGLAPILLPQTKSNIRKDRSPYQELLNSAARSKIESACEKEMTEFGYNW